MQDGREEEHGVQHRMRKKQIHLPNCDCNSLGKMKLDSCARPGSVPGIVLRYVGRSWGRMRTKIRPFWQDELEFLNENNQIRALEECDPLPGACAPRQSWVTEFVDRASEGT